MARSPRTRLTDSPEFDRVYKQGTVYRGKLFSVHAYPNSLGTPRLGLSVSRKVGNAVKRNVVRRRLKEIFYQTVPGKSADVDFVVSARKAASEAGYADLEAEFKRAMRRLGVSSGEATK